MVSTYSWRALKSFGSQNKEQVIDGWEDLWEGEVLE